MPETMLPLKPILVSACLIFGGAPIWAQSDEFEFVIVDMAASDALESIGAQLDVEFTGHQTWRQRVRGLSLTGSRDEVVSKLVGSMNLDYFNFNGQVHLSPTQERTVRLIRLGEVSADAAMAALDQAGLIYPDYKISEVAGGDALVLSGPVKYLAISESIIGTLQPEPVVAEEKVRVRRGGKLEAEEAEVSPVSDDSN